MSCRDLRNFTETMRFLGYPRLISLSNFRVPNFSLVAEILVWLIHRFDPDSDMTAEYETVEDRVSIIRRSAEFIAIKTNIKLNTKKLYQADGHAVHELLKIATALYEAQNKNAEDEIMSGEILNPLVIDITDELSELKNTRQMASQLTVSGASLFDLLGREVQLREIRNSKAARQFDTSQIEVAFKDVIESMKKDIDDTRRQIDNVKETEQNLETKIERRQMELERNKKRLLTLRKVRPAFMEEFEKLEVELRLVYENYLQKCRYLAYLEHLYEDMTKVEQEKFEQRQAATKRQLEQLRGEDASFESIMEGNDSIFTNNIRSTLNLDETERDLDKNDQGQVQAGEITGRASRVQLNQRRLYGTMSGRPRGLRESNDSIGSLDDSDSDLLIDGDLDDDEEDDDIDIENVRGNLLSTVTSHEIAASLDLKGNTEKRSISKAGHVDEDF
ncbi:clusterin-associated protein 1 [Microplitis demolitor]|uniref:clusterin-associated protein 1 n=1 Tax=Microplitis demolitor TaxID=69319 RepID=UPI0006D4E2E5|nr:clusterin-associated protein 1 [Microplitis demolitor]